MKKFWVFVIAFAFGILVGFSIYAYHFNKLKPQAPKTITAVNVQDLDQPPFYVTIKGERWSIADYDFKKITWLNPNTPNGLTMCSQRVIFYDPSRIRNAPEYREVIWHEVVHAEHCGVSADSIKDSNWEEFTHDMPEHASVYELGMFLPGFVHDNPDFMKWAEDWK